MPPPLALLLCILLVCVLLYTDTSDRTKTTVALWIPTIWILILASRMVSQWFAGRAPVSTDAYESGSPIDRAIFLLLIASAFLVVIRRGVSLRSFFSQNPILATFLLYCLLSILWSDFPYVAFKRYFKLIGTVLMVLVVFSERNPVDALLTLFRRCAYVLIPLSIVFDHYFPTIGRAYSAWDGTRSMIGVTNNKNSLGVLAAIAVIGLFASLLSARSEGRWTIDRRKLIARAFVLVLSFWVLIDARSATSLACSLVALTILSLAYFPAIRRTFRTYVLLALVLIGALYFEGSLLPVATEALGRNATFTDRVYLWKDVLSMASNPLTGVGFDSFWLGERLQKLWSLYAWRPTEAHNGYIEIYLNLGLIGLTLLGVLLISQFRDAIASVSNDRKYGSLRFALLIVVLLYNVTEAGFRPDLLIFFVFLLVVVKPVPHPRTPTSQAKRSSLPSQILRESAA